MLNNKSTDVNFKDQEIPKETLVKLKELRAIERKITTSEMKYVIDCFERYGVVNMKQKCQWKMANYNRFRSLVFGKPIINKDDISDIKSLTVLDALMYLNPSYLIPEHQRPLLNVLDKIILNFRSGRVDLNERIRQLYSCPPRGCKTEILTAFMFLLLINFPDLRLVYVSNSQPKAEEVSIKIKDAVAFFYQLSADQNQKSNWVINSTDDTDEMCKGGLKVFTALTIKHGISADMLIIDDLYAYKSDYESKAIRNKIHESLKINALTRLEPTSPVLVVSTRYGTADFINEMLTKFADLDWTYTNVPALDKDGKSYWPKRFPLKTLLKVKKQSGIYGWNALYMGDPINKEGGIFNNIKYYDSIPPGTQVCYGIDIAYTKSTTADYTAITKLHYSKMLDLYFVEYIYKWQLGTDESLRKLKGLLNNQKAYWGCSGLEKAITDLSSRAPYNLNIVAQVVREDKVARANKAATIFDKLLFNPDIEKDDIETIQAFPAARNDDVVDAMVNAILNIKPNNLSVEQMFSQKYELSHDDRSMGFSR